MNPENNICYTPLHVAAKYGHVEVCKFFCLILKEKNPKNSKGVTPLHVAAKHGQLDVCKFLCSNLQEKNPKDGNGRTPLECASSKKHWKVVHFLIVENNLHSSSRFNENVIAFLITLIIYFIFLSLIFFNKI